MRVLVQAATAAPGGSLTTLARMAAAWPATDELLAVTWRATATAALREAGLRVAQIPARSTPEALVTARLRIRDELERFAPDVVWGQQYYLPGCAAPQVLHQRNLLRFLDSGRSLGGLIRDGISSRGMRRARSLVFNSRTLLEAAVERYPWLRHADCYVVHNAVPLVAHPRTSRAERDGIRILMPQSDAPHKRSHWAASVLAELRNRHPELATRVVVRVAGSGSYGLLRAEAERLNVQDHLELLGFLSSSALEDEYLGCDLVLVTSRFESFCNPVIEAQAAGKPVVAADLPVFRELGGPLLRLVARPDPRSVAVAIQEALLDGPSALDWQRGRQFASQFAPSTQAQRMRQVLRSAANH